MLDFTFWRRSEDFICGWEFEVDGIPVKPIASIGEQADAGNQNQYGADDIELARQGEFATYVGVCMATVEICRDEVLPVAG